MATPLSPVYTATEQYLDLVEKGQKAVLGLVEKSVSRIHDLTPEQLSSLVAKATPAPSDLDRGYAIVDRAVSLQQAFARELAKTLTGAQPKATTPAKPKRAA
jgi:hypothetical protein